MGRRARQLLVFLEDLDERKIDYISVRDGHLTGDSASAKIFCHMLVGMAEYESNLISERTRAGLTAKKARGETWGGRKKGQRYRLTLEKLQAVKGLLAEGLWVQLNKGTKSVIEIGPNCEATRHSGRGLEAGAGHLGQISEYGPFADSECIDDLRDRQSLFSELGRPGGL